MLNRKIYSCFVAIKFIKFLYYRSEPSVSQQNQYPIDL